MDRPLSRQPDIVYHGQPGGAAEGAPDVPMDLLALGEVAELLGEPESVIVAACRTFPDHVPVIGSGRGRRFPSVALDVLRLITDATAAGLPAPAIANLIQTHHSPAHDLADEMRNTPGSVPGYESQTSQYDMDDLVGRIQGAVEAELLPVVQMLASEVGSTREAVEQVRAELTGAARADALELLRVETRSLNASQHPPGQAVDVAAELSSLQAQLRPALHGLNEIQVAVEGLREEMAALRWQLDQREQLGQLVAELAELRTQVAGLASTGRARDEDNRGPGESLDQDMTAAKGVGEERAGDGIDAGATVLDDIDPQTAEERSPAAAQPEPEPASAIITEFASRTPRRMGRTIFAEEG